MKFEVDIAEDMLTQAVQKMVEKQLRQPLYPSELLSGDMAHTVIDIIRQRVLDAIAAFDLEEAIQGVIQDQMVPTLKEAVIAILKTEARKAIKDVRVADAAS